MIFASAEPFAEGLVETGLQFGIDEFLLVQWLAPLASESPEFLVAILFAWRGNAAAGMRAMVSSKVNQWTLLVGTLALVYSIASGQPATLPLDGRQAMELFLTSAQSLFAVVLIVALALDWKGALALFVLFIGQLLAPWHGVDLAFAVAYIVLAIGLLLFDGTPTRAPCCACPPRRSWRSLAAPWPTTSPASRCPPRARPTRRAAPALPRPDLCHHGTMLR